ncbi:protein DnrP [Pseudomonas sp. RW407]|uniref:protein DnrP n=1 Tax=Pseudomonas sp. RW407 TaxID=2202894 RepID=UPI000D6F1D81|nr:protein DnrP [Pseudomonas sp. RW407]PWU30795.1 protein DnrP [Pseudomonas sp. RW407]
MRQCLYCQQPSADDQADCPHCGMPLPVEQALARQKRLRRFKLFCMALALFCLAMALWLPR